MLHSPSGTTPLVKNLKHSKFMKNTYPQTPQWTVILFGDKYVQLSPMVFREGNKFSDAILKHMKKEGVVVEVVAAAL